MMRYLSVCSGIEAATVAWHPLGWEPVAFAEVDAFPSAVLKHHYPTVPNFGDMTRFQEWPDAAFDVLVGGTPCQSFSVAGLRRGLADPRGNLALTFLAIADRYRPRWVVWENVPGVLSADSHDGPDPCPPSVSLDGDDGPVDGAEVVVEDEYDADESHAFACLLAGFSELGYFGAYGTLDAQYAGLAQRRKRVFAVFHLGDWQRAAAVLFDRSSLSGHPAPRREAGQVAPTVPSRRAAGGGLGTDFDCDGGGIPSWPADVACTLPACFGSKQGLEDQHALGGASLFVPAIYATDGQANAAFAVDMALTLNDTNEQPYIAHALRADGFDASEDGTGRGTPLVAEPFTLAIRGRGDSHQLEYRQDGTANALLTPNGGRGGIGVGAVAFSENMRGELRETDIAQTLAQTGGKPGQGYPAARIGMAVRRLTPRECERLQGFPDDYTLISYRGKPAADGPRYKALGNSMAVPVMAWIGKRIAAVDDLA
jgi:DNA (cytosine-5)-methyltransferase 1